MRRSIQSGPDTTRIEFAEDEKMRHTEFVAGTCGCKPAMTVNPVPPVSIGRLVSGVHRWVNTPTDFRPITPTDAQVLFYPLY